ncbi:unnamed protein product [Microthlaspi erraticum]|uniref:DUF1985 domain-containing protein n=1 Tax=Microthlaspi erraticum TaxID=1685480 RepID=A0A6D2K4L3_9BRAS|nr:unnamed protein product [Microthlaspi erraticum]
MNEAEDPRSEDHEVQEQEKSHDGNEEETGNEHDEDESQPLPPESFFFSPKQYGNSCKIASRCYVKETVNEIKKYPNELEFFRKHPQFKHIFHIREEPNRKSQGLWMLLLHHARTEKENEPWFVVTGVPIRYSIKEHALLTGLDCHDYPRNYKDLKSKKKGDYKFVKKWFGRSTGITIADVVAMLGSMNSSVNKKKMALLYFLSNVLKAKSKVEGNIEPFLLKVVDDLKLCETFPWGRYTFDDCIAEVKKIMNKFKRGIVKKGDTWCFSGFNLPLEAFAFECIPELGRTFRERVEAEEECPRLCKNMFKETHMKGYPLSSINDAIGTSKNIISILEPTPDEETLMERIIEAGCDDGIGYVDPIVEGWRSHLIDKKKKIFWESLYEADVAGREFTENEDEEPEMRSDVVELKEVIKAFMERMDVIEAVAKEIKDTVGAMNTRLIGLESFVKEQRGKAVESGRRG